MTNNDLSTALTFHVAPDHGDWLGTVRRTVAPADLDLFDLCAERGFHLHPSSLLVHMGELLNYNPEELVDAARWWQAMALVNSRVDHPSAEAFAEFVRSVDAHMAGMAPAHDHGPYVEVVDRDSGETWTCSSFTFPDALYWATSTTQITAIAFKHDPIKPFAELAVTVNGSNLADVSELHVPTDAIRDTLARHHYEHVHSGPDAVLRHLNASTDAHCQELLAGTHTHPDNDIWDLERACSRH